MSTLKVAAAVIVDHKRETVRLVPVVVVDFYRDAPAPLVGHETQGGD